jgi:hypothetical protein
MRGMSGLQKVVNCIPGIGDAIWILFKTPRFLVYVEMGLRPGYWSFQ